jgi:hypothetical protein
MSSICELVSCEAIQQSLDTAFGANNMMPEELGTLSYVLSQENVGSAQIKGEITANSKVNPIKVVYDQRDADDDVEAGRGGCVSKNEECDLTKTYNFDTTDANHKSFTISPQDLAGTCEENSAFVARKIAKKIEGLDRFVAQKLATTIAAEYGNWATTVADIRGVNLTVGNILQVNDYLGTTGEPNTVMFQQVRRALGLSKIQGGIVAGGSALVDYAERAYSRNGAFSGWDLGEMAGRYGFAPIFDRFLADELAAVGATNAAIGRGSVIPLVFALFENQFNKMNDSTNIADVIYSPYTGMMYDLIINRPCPTDPWVITITENSNFITQPDDMYKVGDIYEGVKSLALLDVTCTDFQPCQA